MIFSVWFSPRGPLPDHRLSSCGPWAFVPSRISRTLAPAPRTVKALVLSPPPLALGLVVKEEGSRGGLAEDMMRGSVLVNTSQAASFRRRPIDRGRPRASVRAGVWRILSERRVMMRPIIETEALARPYRSHHGAKPYMQLCWPGLGSEGVQASDLDHETRVGGGVQNSSYRPVKLPDGTAATIRMSDARSLDGLNGLAG